MNKNIRPVYMGIAGVLLIGVSDAIAKSDPNGDGVGFVAGLVDILGLMLVLFAIAGGIQGMVKKRKEREEE